MMGRHSFSVAPFFGPVARSLTLRGAPVALFETEFGYEERDFESLSLFDTVSRPKNTASLSSSNSLLTPHLATLHRLLVSFAPPARGRLEVSFPRQIPLTQGYQGNPVPEIGNRTPDLSWLLRTKLLSVLIWGIHFI